MTLSVTRWRWPATLTMVTFLVTACGTDTDAIVITEARIGQPTGPNAALYFTTAGPDDRLLDAKTDIAPSVEIHQTVTNEDGTTGMRSVDSLDLTGEGLVLEPGGSHLMLVDVAPVTVGDEVEVTVVWEQAGRMTFHAEVVDPSDVVRD